MPRCAKASASGTVAMMAVMAVVTVVAWRLIRVALSLCGFVRFFFHYDFFEHVEASSYFTDRFTAER